MKTSLIEKTGYWATGLSLIAIVFAAIFGSFWQMMAVGCISAVISIAAIVITYRLDE